MAYCVVVPELAVQPGTLGRMEIRCIIEGINVSKQTNL
jgi:hypothetical protein